VQSANYKSTILTLVQDCYLSYEKVRVHINRFFHFVCLFQQFVVDFGATSLQ
jgi:hypothetical protein